MRATLVICMMLLGQLSLADGNPPFVAEGNCSSWGANACVTEGEIRTKARAVGKIAINAQCPTMPCKFARHIKVVVNQFNGKCAGGYLIHTYHLTWTPTTNYNTNGGLVTWDTIHKIGVPPQICEPGGNE